MSQIRAVVLVEGASDQSALATFAERLGRDLEAEGVSIVPMGGASAIGEAIVGVLDVHGPGTKLAGLYDLAEAGDFQRGLERAGLGSFPSRAQMDLVGFFACDEDLEDELIRALGIADAERVVEAQGELRSFRTFQNQPAWRGQEPKAQLRRFIGTKSGRKVRYGRVLVGALDLTRVPPPLDRVLAHVLARP